MAINLPAQNADFQTFKMQVLEWMTAFTNSAQLVAAAVIYFGEPNIDGSWRILRSGNNLVIDRREAGVWVTKQTYTP